MRKLFAFSLIFIFCFEDIFAGEGVDNGKKIQKKILDCQKEFLKYVDKNLLDETEKILKRVSNNEVGRVDKTLHDKNDLEFLKVEYIDAISSILLQLHQLDDFIDSSIETIEKRAEVVRAVLEISNLIYPFEYHGHKYGFERNVKVE